VLIREFHLDDYSPAIALWESADGVGLSDADSQANIALFLRRNPGLSFVAMDGETLVGTILCGHDGRRGLIHHLAVTHGRRREGVGRSLVHSALGALRRAGIHKCHLLVFKANVGAHEFWKRIHAEERESLAVFSLLTADAGVDEGT
jgi:ribosomal protein S18 acetylase RimI-like enzyme